MMSKWRLIQLLRSTDFRDTFRKVISRSNKVISIKRDPLSTLLAAVLFDPSDLPLATGRNSTGRRRSTRQNDEGQVRDFSIFRKLDRARFERVARIANLLFAEQAPHSFNQQRRRNGILENSRRYETPRG